MDIDEDGVTDPSAEFGDLFEGQTVSFENVLAGHDADDVLGAISHDLGISPGGHHHRTTHHPSDNDILAANLNFMGDDYLNAQQIMDHDNQEYMGIPDVSGLGQHHNNIHNQNHHHQLDNQNNGTVHPGNQQIYIHANQQLNMDGTQSMTYQYSYAEPQGQPELPPENIEPEPPQQTLPKVKTKVKVVKSVESFTKENMERYLTKRGFKEKRGEEESRKSISRSVFALAAESQMSRNHSRLVAFGSQYEPECVVQEIERFWKFYVSTKSRNVHLSAEFLPMLVPVLITFFVEMMAMNMHSVARRICMEFSKKFIHEDKSQDNYDILVAAMKVTSFEMVKSDSVLSSVLEKKYQFELTEVALTLMRQFLSKSTQPVLTHLFTNVFTISSKESKELMQSFDWDDLQTCSEDSSDSDEEEESEDLEQMARREYVTKVIDDLRNSATANLPDVSVYTTGENPVCGNISKKGSLIAYGLAEAGIRLCTVENARDVAKINPASPQPVDPDKFYGVKSLCGHSGTVYGVHFHPQTKLLFSVGQDSQMRAWDLNGEDPRCRVVYRGHSGPVWKLDIPDSGSMIATSGLDSTARIFVPERTEFVRVMVGHYASVNAVKFHPNEAYIATGSVDKSVRLWSVNDGEMVRMYTGSSGSINCLAFHESGKYLAGAGEDASISVWDLAQGELIARLDSLPNCKDLDFCGHMLSACYRNGMLQVFNLRQILGSYSGDSYTKGRPPSISEPFTTQCFAKSLFKVQYMNSGKLVCLGSDQSIDTEEAKFIEKVKSYVEKEMASSKPKPQKQVSTGSETLLQQALQSNTPVQTPVKTKQETTPGSKRKNYSNTAPGSTGGGRILAARLSQTNTTPIPTPVPESVEVIKTEVMEESVQPSSETQHQFPGSSIPNDPNSNSTQQMITSAELDAAIASVIDQSGGDNADCGGTITMYAST